MGLLMRSRGVTRAAPRQVLAHLSGGRVHADVAQRLVDSTLNKALADNNVQPLSQPSIAPAELAPNDAFQYKARFEVRPDIEKVEWEGYVDSWKGADGG